MTKHSHEYYKMRRYKNALRKSIRAVQLESTAIEGTPKALPVVNTESGDRCGWVINRHFYGAHVTLWSVTSLPTPWTMDSVDRIRAMRFQGVRTSPTLP